MSSARLFLESDLGRPESHPFLAREVTVFARRSPDKEAPNEDAIAIVPAGDDAGVLALADGVGGQPGGAGASALALRTLAKSIERRAPGDSLRGAILDGIEEANRAVLALGSATTIVVAELKGNTMRSYHVGDSVALVCGQRGRVKLQTVPHSPVGYAVEAGVLDEDEALEHADRHLITNALGSADMRIEIASRVELAARDTLLLASDGLVDNLYPSEIVELIRKGALLDSAGELTALAEHRMGRPEGDWPSKPDDLSFVLYRGGGERQGKTTGRSGESASTDQRSNRRPLP